MHTCGLSRITNNLFLGSYEDSKNYDCLKCNNIKYIVNLSCHPNPYPDCFEYLKIDMNDLPDQNIEKYFDYVSKWINDKIQSGNNVLVNCFAGISRSSTFVIAYLVMYKGYTLVDAYKHVKNRRSIIEPNIGFQKQLIDKFYNNQNN